MKFIPSAVTRVAARRSLSVQKHAPQLLFGTGVVGMVGSTVLACRATLKLEEVLDEIDNNKLAAHGALAIQSAEDYDGPEYTEKDMRQDLMVINVRGVLGIIKLYAPAVVLGSVSIACLTKSHNLLNERNAALMAAYAALDKGFSEYRARVIAKHGEQEDDYLRYNTEAISTTNAKGKTETIVRVAGDEPSIYARFFDEYCEGWSKDPEVNALYLKCKQNWANQLLQARGYVFLNEVYRDLGLPESSAGQVVGWVLSKNPETTDNYIDFGVFRPDAPDRVRDFVNGRERSVLLDFNVDGVIFDKLDGITQGAISWQKD